MRVTETDRLGAVGVSRAQLIVEQELGWIFRRQEHRDTGVDAVVEVVLNAEATGLYLALQIKCGRSYLSKPTPDGWRYRGRLEHLQYWQEHNLAVLVVVVDPDSDAVYWVHIGKHADIRRNARSWTIDLPRGQRVSAACATQWVDLAWAENPIDALYRYCALHAKYIDVLARGGRVLVEIDEWVNKTRGQAEFRLLREEPNGLITAESFFVFAGASDVGRFLGRIFPWANVEVDEDYYSFHEDQPSESAVGNRPYTQTGGGEIACYRMTLSLNAIGLAYGALSTASSQLAAPPPFYMAKVLVRLTEPDSEDA